MHSKILSSEVRAINDEFELISCDRLRHVKIFLNSVTYRNYHIHGFFELLLVLGGTGRINMRSQSVEAAAGSMLLLNPYEPHEIDCPDNMTALFIQISRHFLEEYVPNFGETRFSVRDISEYLASRPDDLRALSNGAIDAALPYFAMEEGFQLRCLQKLAGLLSIISELIPGAIPDSRDVRTVRRRIGHMAPILAYLDENFRLPVRLGEISAMTGLTETYISHLFTGSMGISFQDYLSRLRFENALSLIRSTDLSATEIALQSGFSDQKYLSRMMEKKFGCTVAQYRLTAPPMIDSPARDSSVREQTLDDASAGELLIKFREKS